MSAKTGPDTRASRVALRPGSREDADHDADADLTEAGRRLSAASPSQSRSSEISFKKNREKSPYHYLARRGAHRCGGRQAQSGDLSIFSSELLESCDLRILGLE